PVIKRLTALIQSEQIKQPRLAHAVAGIDFWARQPGFDARSAFSAAALVAFIARQVDARLIETGVRPERFSDAEKISLIRQRLIATASIAGMRTRDITSRWTAFAQVLLPLIFEENHTVFQMLQRERSSASSRPTGMFLAPLLVDGASLLSEPVTSSIKMIAANWAALYSRGASFSFSIDTFFPLIRLLCARDYVLVVSLLHHPPTGSRLTFKLYRLRREQMQLRRIGSVVARFFPAKKIMELGEPSNEPYHEV